MGGLIWILTGLVSFLGGVYALLEGSWDKRNRFARFTVPLLWAWQIFGFMPWATPFFAWGP